MSSVEEKSRESQVGNLEREERQVVFTRQPTAEDMRPTERHRRMLEELSDWRKQSAKTDWFLKATAGR